MVVRTGDDKYLIGAEAHLSECLVGVELVASHRNAYVTAEHGPAESGRGAERQYASGTEGPDSRHGHCEEQHAGH